jgi:glycine betaine/proline transport system permease protein
MCTVAPLVATTSRPTHVQRRLAVVGSIAAALVAAQWFGAPGFPDSLNLGIADPVNSAQGWIRESRDGHWLFTWILNPFTWLVRSGLDSVEAFLTWLPWYVPIIAVFLLVAKSRRFGLATACALAVAYPGVVGVWKESIETISLMSVAVAFSVAVGVPLGIWAAFRPRVEASLRPLLDAMQTVPATIYLIPTVLLFGIGQVPAAIATIIYALPPMVRLTVLGIRQVPPQAVEASRMFGATRRQTLSRVQIPLAMPSIVAGVNQTVMMALGIVVIATLVGAGGLGQAINQTVRQLSPGRGLVVSLAVVAVAFVLDRMTQSLVTAPDRPRTPVRRQVLWSAIGAVVAVTVLGKVLGHGAFPFSWGTSFAAPLDDAVVWLRDALSFATRPFNDFVVRDVLLRTRDLMTEVLSWQAVVVAGAAFAWLVAGLRVALFTAAATAFIGATGLWVDATDTFAQTVVAVMLSIAIAVPVGIWLGRRPRIESALSPLLDSLQTIPPLIYAIPFVMLFTVGPVPGVVAAVVYAIPPGIRLTSLGIRQVNRETLEAATTFGATQRQLLWGVRIPLAMPSIVLAVNQMVMMVLAMAIIAGMVGGGGLGYRSIEALTAAGGTGLGAEVGIAVVLMASVLDRLTQSAARRLQAPESV